MSTTGNIETAQEFDERVAQTQSGAAEVQDFVLKTSYAFPAADVLLPAPMAVSILGQLTLVATATDFKFVARSGGYQHIRYPDSFRATIIQLVNTGALTLNRSFTNFNEINQLCAAVRPGVNGIVQLLAGHPDNTPAENDLALKRYLPDQIESLSSTVQTCLHRAKETHGAFDDLLKLTMEVHEACTATQGHSEMRAHEEKLRMAALEKEQAANEEMKRISKDIFDTSKENFDKAQTAFHNASGDMPGVGELFVSSIADAALCAVNFVTFNSLGLSSGGSNGNSANTSDIEEPPPDTRDPAWQKASALREQAEVLSALLASGPKGRPDWNTITSKEVGGCPDIWVNLEEIEKFLKKKKNAGKPTERALALARKGIDYAHRLHDVVPPGDGSKMEELASTITDWCDNVVEFSAQADMKLKISPFKRQAFVQHANTAGRMPITTTRINQARYKLEVAEGQLNLAREQSKHATDQLMQVTGRLGEIMGQLAKVDIQKRNWEEIAQILSKAIAFLCELKRYLNNLVRFFDFVNTLVSIKMRDASNRFIKLVRAAEENTGQVLTSHGAGTGAVNLDAWGRQAIYDHALSLAKISRVVENISGMYVTLYDSNVHPGVNMLLGMGKLVGSGDQQALVAARCELEEWARNASNRIVQLVNERAQANERDIMKRMEELEKTLGSILPPSSNSRIKEAVEEAKEEEARESARATSTAARGNPVYQKMNLFV